MDAIYSSYGDWVKTPGGNRHLRKGRTIQLMDFSQLRYVLAGRSDSVGLINKNQYRTLIE